MRHTTKVLGLLALVLALGGTATAAGVLVTSSKQIRNGTIKQVDLDAKARSAFLQPGPQGAPGPRGEAGPAGPKGDAGAPAPAQIEDGIIGPEKLSFRALQPGDIRVNGEHVAEKEELEKGWHAVAGAVTEGSDDAGRALLIASVSLTGPGVEGSATVEGRLLIDGEVVSDDWRTTLDAAESRVLTFQASPYLAPGDHQFELQVQTSGDSVIVGGRSVDLIAFRPIWNPPRGVE